MFATVLFDDLFSFEKHITDWFGFNYNERSTRSTPCFYWPYA